MNRRDLLAGAFATLLAEPEIASFEGIKIRPLPDDYAGDDTSIWVVVWGDGRPDSVVHGRLA